MLQAEKGCSDRHFPDPQWTTCWFIAEFPLTFSCVLRELNSQITRPSQLYDSKTIFKTLTEETGFLFFSYIDFNLLVVLSFFVPCSRRNLGHA